MTMKCQSGENLGENLDGENFPLSGISRKAALVTGMKSYYHRSFFYNPFWAVEHNMFLTSISLMLLSSNILFVMFRSLDNRAEWYGKTNNHYIFSYSIWSWLLSQFLYCFWTASFKHLHWKLKKLELSSTFCWHTEQIKIN